MRILGIIPARAGSKRIPNKNMALCGGKPLIYWTIEAAITAETLTRVVVSTDSTEIKTYARRVGKIDTPWYRPGELAQDWSSSMEVVSHAVEMEGGEVAWDYVMLLPPTSPLRTSSDIDAVVSLVMTKQANSVVSVTTPWHYPVPHPVGEYGQIPPAALFRLLDTTTLKPTMADFAHQYVLNGAIYCMEAHAFSWYTAPCYAYIMPPERSVDIDEPWQLELATYFLQKRDSV